jgi:hypothetical protein
MRYKHLEYTTVSELIQMLQDFAAKEPGNGDIPVAVDGKTPVHLSPEPYYYDGGYWLEDVERPKDDGSFIHYVRSRTLLLNDKEFKHGWVLHVESRPAFSEETDTVDGKTEIQ